VSARYGAPAGERSGHLLRRQGAPAGVLLVFNRIGERNPNRTIPRLMELTRHLWQGQRRKGFHDYDGRIPIIATGLKNLSQHGPAGSVFLRSGRDHMEPLREAIGNSRREAPKLAPGKRPRVPRRSTRRRCSARRRSRPRSRQPSVRRAVRCAPAAGRSSPTNAGLRHRRWTGAPQRTPTRTCVTAASTGPTLPRPRRPMSRGTGNR
jgi:hypothetical protein